MWSLLSFFKSDIPKKSQAWFEIGSKCNFFLDIHYKWAVRAELRTTGATSLPLSRLYTYEFG